MKAAIPLRLCAIGEVRLEADGAPHAIPGRTARALLGYLSLVPGNRDRRSRLAGLLWPDLDEGAARQNLRQVLYEIRQGLPGDLGGFVMSDRQSIWLDPARVVLDHAEVTDALAQGTVPDMLLRVPQVAERLLDDVTVETAGFEAWLRLRRRAFEEGLSQDLTRLLRAGPAAREDRHAAARALWLLDPSDEAATRQVMRDAMEAGDVTGAIRAYDALWELLDREFDMEPSEETQALVAAIKLGEMAAAPAEEGAVIPLMPARAARPDRPTIRVDCAPGDADEARLLERLRDDLIACLCRFRALRILDGAAQPGQAAFQLRLSASEGAGRVDLAARLTALAEGDVVWSFRTEHAVRDWMALRSRIASNIAVNCDISLSRRRLAEIGARGDLGSVFAAWLQGQDLLDRFRPEAWRQAEQVFRQAATAVPDFSPAHSSLAQVCNIRHLVFPGVAPDEATARAGLDHADRAVSADPFDARAHLARGWSCMLMGRWGDGETSFGLALASNPDDPWTVISVALGMAFLGEVAQARELAARFLREGWTTSQSTWGYHANIRFLAGDLEGALSACDSAGEGILNLPAWAAAAEAERGNLVAAGARWRAFEDLARPHWVGEGPADRAALLGWFQGLFPIRDDAARARLWRGAEAAARAAG